MSNNSFITTLSDGLDFFHLPSSESFLKKYSCYFDILSDWNSRMNLVSKGELNRFVEYHILDSLKITCCVNLSSFHSVIDFGSGAGLPGIPLAIAYPDIHFTLLDSIQKKTFFLESLISELSLSNVTVIRSRAEDVSLSSRSFFDCVVTRATVTLSSYFQLCSRFLKENGSLVSIKGNTIESEFSDLLKIVDSKVFNISDCIPMVPDYVRSGHIIVIVKK
jgi:16S rRNA (guanine527-N7)-methyltransferase